MCLPGASGGDEGGSALSGFTQAMLFFPHPTEGVSLVVATVLIVTIPPSIFRPLQLMPVLSSSQISRPCPILLFQASAPDLIAPSMKLLGDRPLLILDGVVFLVSPPVVGLGNRESQRCGLVGLDRLDRCDVHGVDVESVPDAVRQSVYVQALLVASVRIDFGAVHQSACRGGLHKIAGVPAGIVVPFEYDGSVPHCPVPFLARGRS